MVPYTRNVVAVIKMGAYIHGCLFSMGAHYPGGGGGGGGGVTVFTEETYILKSILGSTSKILASFESSSVVDSKYCNNPIQPKIT